jgi:8-amino-7-oxononanoate synthase
MNPDPLSWLDQVALERSRLGLTRSLTPISPGTAGRVEREGRQLINFASNDYLGLSNDPRVVAAAQKAAGRFGWGAGASPLVCGWKQPHQELIEVLASFEGTEAVALFPTGYAANLGTIIALLGPEDAVFGDRLNHSCLFQGARLSGARMRVFPHRDTDRLETLLRRERDRYRRALIVTDGVFSMDGDLAPLPELVALSERFGAMLLVDEAHGTGVFGADGRGASSALGVADRVPIRVGTLSKAIGSIGGFVAGSRRLIDHLINSAPTLIYSTAMPPAAAAAAVEALRIIGEEPWRRERVHLLGRQLRIELRGKGFEIPSSEGPIVPVILGETERTIHAAGELREHGVLVPAIRPPTVPRGTARLRICLSASHSESEIRTLVQAMKPFDPQ